MRTPAGLVVARRRCSVGCVARIIECVATDPKLQRYCKLFMRLVDETEHSAVAQSGSLEKAQAKRQSLGGDLCACMRVFRLPGKPEFRPPKVPQRHRSFCSGEQRTPKHQR
jgi:hypothetical protein